MSPLPQHGGEGAAVLARREWDLSPSLPIDDLLAFVEKIVGIPVLIERFGADEIAGVLMRRADGGAFIAINADHNARRQRFTLAHELGHYQMGHQPRVDYVKNLHEGGNGGNPQEVEANYFAAEFLCPRNAANDWLDRNGVKTAGADDAARLAMEFGLSFSTACYRLERAGEFSTAAKKRVLAELNADPALFARRYGSLRLNDEIERLAQVDREGKPVYPRKPLQTRTYAAQALEAGLIDDDEYEHLTGAPVDDPDPAAWVS